MAFPVVCTVLKPELASLLGPADLEENQDASGAMCRRRRGAGNKNQEPCRDFSGRAGTEIGGDQGEVRSACR